MEIRKDILGNTPKIGDLVAFNPPYYKGLKVGEIVGFSSSGLPKLNFEKPWGSCQNGYTPKTEFVIARHNNYQIF